MKKIIFLILTVLLLTACTAQTPDKGLSVTGYFISEASPYSLTTHTLSVKNNGAEAIPELFAKLSAPPDKKLTSPIPGGLSLIEYSILEDTCTLKLSSYYNNLSETQRVSFNATVTNTFCQLPGVNCVLILCDDNLTMFEPDDFLTTLPRTRYDSFTVNLYFTSENHSRIVKETKNISISDDTNLEKEVVTLLSQNPTSSDVDAPFPSGTEINSVTTTDGTCIVDVSEEFVVNAPHDADSEKNILFSIVNTLTELPKIDRVKFLINGAKGYGYSYYNIAEPLTNLESLFVAE